ALALQAPRFDQDDIDLAKSVVLAALEDQKNNPDRLGWDKFGKEFYGDHPLGSITTEATINAITRDDLVERHKALFARSNLTVGVAGTIDEGHLSDVLYMVFADLPEEASSESVAASSPAFEVVIHLPYDRPQNSIALVYAGVRNISDDIYAATVVTNLLG